MRHVGCAVFQIVTPLTVQSSSIDVCGVVFQVVAFLTVLFLHETYWLCCVPNRYSSYCTSSD